MDGDLQHPPAVIAEMLDASSEGDVDLVMASRYQPSASNLGLSRWPRKLLSTACGRAARLSFSRRLADVTDPMSGFFLDRQVEARSRSAASAAASRSCWS